MSADPVLGLALRDKGGPAQPLLTVTGLRKHFALPGGFFRRNAAKVRAVDGVSFTVAKGETLGVVGESGCGKSTTARLVARLIEPDAGELVFDGEAVGAQTGLALKDYRRSLQMVFQDSYASLNPRMPVAEAVAYGPQVHGMPARAARQRAYDLLARVGLAPEVFAQRYPHELSGGQRQRVNIARARPAPACRAPAARRPRPRPPACAGSARRRSPGRPSASCGESLSVQGRSGR
ncbi:MAG: ATP-binding cassette domain-containing protein, partial [Caulobacter sp.]|nr:ATP-binding cassette domain-containing protein [Vitreoscilla sp.]